MAGTAPPLAGAEGAGLRWVAADLDDVEVAPTWWTWVAHLGHRWTFRCLGRHLGAATLAAARRPGPGDARAPAPR